MASDLVVALGQATVNGTTLFGSNCHAEPGQRQRLHRVAGGHHPLDEPVRTTYLRLPQARQTHTILGQQADGDWGLTHGVNASHVAIGVTSWHSRMSALGGALTGTDLTRLALERSHTALHAIDVLTDLIGRHGQCADDGNQGMPADNLFLVADAQEAYVLEAAGRYWAILECRQVRAVTDVALIHQDWQRIAPGLATLAIEQGWWNDDGSKLDFAGSVGAASPAHATGRRRWGRATLALEQQNGAIDSPFLRRMLLDHDDSTAAVRTHRAAAPLAGSFAAALPAGNEPAFAWCAFGPSATALYFPIWLDGELPAAWQECRAGGTDVWRQTQELRALADSSDDDRIRVNEALERLQTTFQQDADAFVPHDRQRLHIQATGLMQKHVSLFARECRQLHGAAASTGVSAGSGEFVSYIA